MESFIIQRGKYHVYYKWLEIVIIPQSFSKNKFLVVKIQNSDVIYINMCWHSEAGNLKVGIDKQNLHL